VTVIVIASLGKNGEFLLSFLLVAKLTFKTRYFSLFSLQLTRLSLLEVVIIIDYNRVVIIVNFPLISINFSNCFDKALTEIFQFCRALVISSFTPFDKLDQVSFNW